MTAKNDKKYFEAFGYGNTTCELYQSALEKDFTELINASFQWFCGFISYYNVRFLGLKARPFINSEKTENIKTWFDAYICKNQHKTIFDVATFYIENKIHKTLQNKSPEETDFNYAACISIGATSCKHFGITEQHNQQDMFNWFVGFLTASCYHYEGDRLVLSNNNKAFSFLSDFSKNNPDVNLLNAAKQYIYDVWQDKKIQSENAVAATASEPEQIVKPKKSGFISMLAKVGIFFSSTIGFAVLGIFAYDNFYKENKSLSLIAFTILPTKEYEGMAREIDSLKAIVSEKDQVSERKKQKIKKRKK